MADRGNGRRYDAVLVPAQYPRGKTGQHRAVALTKEFARDLGTRRVHAFATTGFMSLLVPEGEPTHRFHAVDHPSLAGVDRFDWHDRGDGVCYGLLTAEAAVSDDDRDRAAAQAVDESVRRRTAQTKARHAELAAKPPGERTAAEQAEHAKLGRFLAAAGEAPADQAPEAAGASPAARARAAAAAAGEQAPAAPGPGSQPPVADRDAPGAQQGVRDHAAALAHGALPESAERAAAERAGPAAAPAAKPAGH